VRGKKREKNACERPLTFAKDHILGAWGRVLTGNRHACWRKVRWDSGLSRRRGARAGALPGGGGRHGAAAAGAPGGGGGRRPRALCGVRDRRPLYPGCVRRPLARASAAGARARAVRAAGGHRPDRQIPISRRTCCESMPSPASSPRHVPGQLSTRIGLHYVAVAAHDCAVRAPRNMKRRREAGCRHMKGAAADGVLPSRSRHAAGARARAVSASGVHRSARQSPVSRCSCPVLTPRLMSSLPDSCTPH